MRAARTVDSWTRAWGLTLLSIASFHILPAQAQEDTSTDRAEQGDDAREHNPKHHHYKLIDTGTLGGPTSSLGFEGERDINNRGAVVSLADTSLPDPYAPNCFLDCFLAHMVEWRNGVLTDVGALPISNDSGPIWINDSGLVSGLSENGVMDPLSGAPEFRAILWKDGEIVDLGTLGGNESIAGGVNNRGQVVGGATNATPDPFGACGIFAADPQQCHAFLWQNGVMEDLGTLGGPDSIANVVNEQGQVAGWSFIDSTANSTTGIPIQHPFLWEKGEMRDLGTIGGTKVYLVNSLNNRGHVVGGMYVVGDQSYHPFLWDGVSLKDLGTLGGDFGSADWINETGDVVGWALTAGNQSSHAFLWQKGLLTDLGTVDGDPSSTAFVVNSKRQVVGATQDNNFSYVHAFLWERGSIVDLNALIPDDSRVRLMAAVGLNERGEIVTQGVLPNGDLHAFLLIPCDENHANDESCDYSMVDEAATTRENPPSILQEASATVPHIQAPYGPSNEVRRTFQGRFGFNIFMGNPQQGALSATTAISGSIATLSPTSEAFSTQPIGTVSAAHTVTLKNTGTTSVTITAIAIAGTNAGDFGQTHTCGSTLAAGASCNVNVTFKPTASGMRTAALSVTDNAAGSPQKATLSGIGTAAKLSPTSLSFGSVGLRATSLPKTITLTNVGTTTLSIIGISISGPNAGDFAQSHTCGTPLAAGRSCALKVTFTPSVLGTRTATLNITDNANGSPQKVAFSGVGVAGGKLTGYCVMGRIVGPPGCAIVSDRTQCAPGKPATNPTVIECGVPFSIDVDEGSSCHLPGPFRGGRCQWTP